jgi:phosphatidate cytidylyltransferase
MKKRTITGLIMLAILAPVFVYPGLIRVFDVFMLGACLLASLELLHMYEKERKIPLVVKIIDIVLTIILYCAIINSGIFEGQLGIVVHGKELNESAPLVLKAIYGMRLQYIITPVNAVFAIFIVIMSTMILKPDFTVKDAGKLLIAIIYVSVGIGAFTILRYLGVRFVIYLLSIVVATDIFAYFSGMLFGKHKMAPTISPKKTWEGAIGGTTIATIIGFLVLFLYDSFSPVFHEGVKMSFFFGIFDYDSFSLVGKIFFILTLTLLLSVTSQIGDLVASKLKRNYGIKDYSNLFPGHGGILDRFDSWFFASAIFLAFLISEASIFAI